MNPPWDLTWADKGRKEGRDGGREGGRKEKSCKVH